MNSEVLVHFSTGKNSGHFQQFYDLYSEYEAERINL